MRLTQLPRYIGYISLVAAAWLGFASHALAQFTLSGNTAELVTRGINANFETPVLAATDAEAFNSDLGQGWTFNLISGVSSNQGLQNPALGFYGQVNPLPAPFESNQIGFFNLDAFTQAEIVSDPIGRLRSGQNYTLNIAVGARNNDGWSDIAYRVGLRAGDGTDLGTFATVTLDPSSTSPMNITELQYTLNSSIVPSYVGSDVSIVVGAFNIGENGGELLLQFTQANVDNVRLAGSFDELAAPLTAQATINRQTGGITLNNTAAANFNILGYSLTSDAGAFNQAAWTTIASSNSNWTVLTEAGSTSDLSESDFVTASGTVLSTTTPRSLGPAWLRTPFGDVQGELLLADGSILPLTVEYAGTAIPSGDLNGDGAITTADWTLFKAGQGTNFSSLSDAQAYLKGDLNGDAQHDLADFIAFRAAYDAANGAGSFAAMVAVPEPSSALLLIAGSLVILTSRRRKKRQEVLLMMNRISRSAVALIVGLVACALATAANAQGVVAHWSFDSPTLTIAGGNITAVAEQTGSHNAMVSATGLGGADGMTYVSAPFAAASSVNGQFGEGLRFNGDNFLVFPNLTELMEASGGPSFSVSMWVQWLGTTAPGGGTPFATLGDWGNAAADSGVANESSRFTYAFGPNAATTIRNQVRRNNPDNGNGDDIWAVTETVSPAVNDGSWHMLTWTMDTTTGISNAYYDGVFVNDTQSGDPNFKMANSTSPVGTFGLKGDSGGFLTADTRLDEVWVFNGVLSGEQVNNLFIGNSVFDAASLTLRVDPANGQVSLRNDTPDPITFNAYRITSAGGSLNPSGWDPIASGATVPGFPQGNGTGNGWESPGAGGGEGDFNGDGTVDAADYSVWRDGLGGAFTPAQHNVWKENFGEVSGGNANSGELVEWYLQGDSTLAASAAIDLGQAFSTGGAQDLVFQFTTDTGVVRTGLVEYGAIGSGAALAVPEPSAAWLMLLAAGAVAAWASGRRTVPRLVPARATTCLVALLASTSATTAAVTLDRHYRFGENGALPQTLENGSDNMPVGSGAGNPLPGATLDHVGPSGSFQGLLALSNGGGALPVYESVSAGAPGSSLGILFDGTDDYLSGFSLGFPPLSRGTINGGGTGTLNYNGVYQRGFQLWVFPQSGATAEQHIVSDTTQHGVRITVGGNWALVHAGGGAVNSNVAVAFDQWSHVMAAIPEISNPYKGVLYVNGVAVAAKQANYSTALDVNAQALVVGANSHTDGNMIGTANHFRGELDELEMFVWGQAYDHTAGQFIDYGTFEFATDNGFAASFLTGVPGDINNSGSVTQADINAFVAGWRNQKQVNGIHVGDLTTFAKGDLNFDGITDLSDARLLMQALPGSGAEIDLGAFAAVTGVPEPSSLFLGGIAIGALLLAAARRN